MGDALYSVCTGSRASGTHTLIGRCVRVPGQPPRPARLPPPGVRLRRKLEHRGRRPLAAACRRAEARAEASRSAGRGGEGYWCVLP
jgi:hypothetical protein